ncbi:dimethyladenosine transferase [Anaerobacterium chartisolvens]|uniref:Ribosomal RNA small subunit methyltransferase A n=1 Tax=Anaerobacterium chartisolvens TaxID=1297424 RepID=A0A369BCX0_9FIRM|nr:16S rRNA (adenine(1518)-N(6)/adenine(1519)-N(6))-dimethyltransferase RsmA [Anaerobacterium chartisolvens]RCX18297.1 dimethyladenosine transferase [Anaerobacterium chartisolvens]
MDNIKGIIRKNNIRLTKALGQNFLNDEGIVNRIVDAADVGKEDVVIEIGPGIGSMTHELCKRAGEVFAVEIDARLIPVLAQNLKGFSNLHIINNDVMKLDLKRDIISLLSPERKPEAVKVAANLPYYITTPIIMKLLEENPGIDSMVFMVQKEVAERMTAAPGGKDYGALSLAVQYYSRPRAVFDVPPHCFIPQPGVYSTVIRLDIFKTPPVTVKSEELFFKIVKAAFGQRRKTLLNALSNSGCLAQGKQDIRQVLEDTGIGESRRGETLSIEQFAQLSNAFFEKGNSL